MSLLKGIKRTDGFIEIDDKVRFKKNVEFHQGPGINFDRQNTYYVDGRDGSDNYTGLDPTNAKATIAAAITVMNARIGWSNSPWAQRDVLYIAPGSYAEELTALPYGCVVVGVGHDIHSGKNGVIIKPASGYPVEVTSTINTAFYNLSFVSPDTSAAFKTVNLNNSYFYNCKFSGLPSATTAVYGVYCSDLSGTWFDHCWFMNADNGLYINYVDGGDKCAKLLVENCMFTGLAATGIYVSTQLVGEHSIVRHNTIIGGGQTLTLGIDDNIACIDESFNSIEATTAVDGVRSSNGTYGNGTLLT